MPSINLETGDANMGLVYETAADVPGERCVLMGSGQPVADARRKPSPPFANSIRAKHRTPSSNASSTNGGRKSPRASAASGCLSASANLRKIWPHLIGTPVGRIHFAGAAYDNMPHGQDAATRTGNRVAEAIHAAG